MSEVQTEAEQMRARVEAEARRYAGFYSEASDGRNTFVIFADWVASLPVKDRISDDVTFWKETSAVESRARTEAEDRLSRLLSTCRRVVALAQALAPAEMAEVGALKPCPFCGSAAERVDIPDEDDVDGGVNAGGSCIQCTRCAASSALHFDRKENLVSSWNDRAALPASPLSLGEAT